MGSIIQKGEEGTNSVIAFKPKKIGDAVSTEAKQFFSKQKEKTNAFRVSEVVSEITGLGDIERAEVDKKIEEAALEKLESIQEEAYAKAYELGQDEGKKEALEAKSSEIESGLNEVAEVVKKIKSLKMDLIAQNEAQIVDLVYFVAKQIAMLEIEKNDERIIPVLRECLKSAQSDEQILVRLSTEDHAQFQKLRESLPKEIEYLREANFEAQNDITKGGCIIETNYGVIDASLEQRVEKGLEHLGRQKAKNKG